MKIAVQTDNINLLSKVMRSECDVVRFGSEFCEWKVPNLAKLKEAYEATNTAKKEFKYVTPKVSECTIEGIKAQLDFLDGIGGVSVVINDLGLLNMFEHYPNLRPHLGRQLIYIPARNPWKEIVPLPLNAGFFEGRNVLKMFYQTSLNYDPTTEYFKKRGIHDVDVDWIPKCFRYLKPIVNGGFNISVVLYTIVVTITRTCHTARFLGEQIPEECSRPCDERAFLLQNKILGVELLLCGNAVFRLSKPSKNDVIKLCGMNIAELVIPVNPITKIEDKDGINEVIDGLRS